MIFGKFGCPALGLEGAAWATFISRTAILVGMFVWLYRGRRNARVDAIPLVQATCGLAMSDAFSESDFRQASRWSARFPHFRFAGLMMGRFGETAMAAHQVALMCAATAFMVPLGLSMALGVRIGSANGAGQVERLRKIIVSGWWIGVGWAVIGAVFFLFAGSWVSSLFISEVPGHRASRQDPNRRGDFSDFRQPPDLFGLHASLTSRYPHARDFGFLCLLDRRTSSGRFVFREIRSWSSRCMVWTRHRPLHRLCHHWSAALENDGAESCQCASRTRVILSRFRLRWISKCTSTVSPTALIERI